jgi:hypothetical protein
VVDELGRAVGLVSITQVQALAHQRRLEELAGVADRDPALIVLADEDVADLLERPAPRASGARSSWTSRAGRLA